MADVTMTYEALNSAAKKIEQAQADLNDAITLFQGAVQALEGNWSGQSYNAFIGAWEKSKPTMEKLSAAVGAFAPELENAVYKQQERESTSAKSMSNLAF